MQLIKLPVLVLKYAKSRSSIYQDVNDKLLPPPVKMGLRSSAWPLHEIESVIAARVAGKSSDEIKALVAELVSARTAAN